MIAKTQLGKLGLSIVLRHYWDKKSRLMWRHDWNQKKLGIFWSKSLAVGSKTKGKDAFLTKNLIPCYLFGLNLIWVKIWIEVDWGKVLRFNIDPE